MLVPQNGEYYNSGRYPKLPLAAPLSRSRFSSTEKTSATCDKAWDAMDCRLRCTMCIARCAPLRHRSLGTNLDV